MATESHPYKEKYLVEHQKPLVWAEPPNAWLDKHDCYWKERIKTEKHKQDYLNKYDYLVVNPDNPIGFRYCSICELVFDNTRWMDLHFKTFYHQCKRADKKGTTRPKDPLLCEVCNIRFTSKLKKRNHEAGYEHLRAVAIQQGQEPPPNPTHCTVCDQRFTTMSRYTKHLETTKHKKNVAKANQKKLFRCEKCDKTYTTLQSYNRHLGSDIHKYGVQQLKTFCEICKKQFKNRRQYLKHTRESKTHKRLSSSIKVV